MTRLAVVWHSGYGHTARVADAVVRGVASVADVQALSVPVAELADPPADTVSRGGVLNRVGSYTGVMTTSADGPAEDTLSADELETARLFGMCVGRTSVRWARGKAPDGV